jgi:mono/diheme cytochrome c family protein
MSRNVKSIKLMAIATFAVSAMMTSCVSDSNSPGLEYMPDMYRSAPIEAYVDYGEFKGKYVDSLVKDNPALLPPTGTVPYSKVSLNDMPYEHGAPFGWDKSHGLYGFDFDSTGYTDAIADVNPIEYSDDVKKEGKALYGKFCIHCHGEKGDGQGSVVTNGGYPAPPSYQAALKDLPAGQIFYSVTYGKGLMGSHSSQLTKEERWKVVYHVQTLQGKTIGETADTTVVVEMAELPEPIEAEHAEH